MSTQLSYKKATGLQEEITDNSTSGRMKDDYTLNLFSWQTFIKLLAAEAGRYDASYYVMPFAYMEEAIMSINWPSFINT